ncbi:MAG: hypothetical protein IPL26_10125 [Leptospiraceae bacterium]|nr:hypothetical protein [Leptospiraceae bacterium]
MKITTKNLPPTRCKPHRKDLINQVPTMISIPTIRLTLDRILSIILTINLFLIFPLYSQEPVREINYQSIKQKIQAGYLDGALKDTEDLLRENQGDATLELYQAEIWIEKGERYFKRRKYRSSLIEFEKVYKVWSNNGFVRQRYFELKSMQPLVDYEEDNTSLTALVPMGLQGTEIRQDLLDESKTNSSDGEDIDWKSLDAKDRILYRHIIRLENLLVAALLLLGIINVSLLYTISKKK